jgi:hypothetical protein
MQGFRLEPDLDRRCRGQAFEAPVFSELGKQGLEWRLEPEAFAGREVGREGDLLDVLVGCPVDIEVARQPSAQASVGVFDAAFLP